MLIRRHGSSIGRIVLIFACVIISCVAIFVGLMFQLEREAYREEAPAIGALPTAIVNIGSREIIAELAMTNAAREQGLSDRASLAEDHGMLFLFDQSDAHTFWMHGMQFPLDIIFLRDDVVVDIHANVPHPAISNGIPTILKSKTEADQVLEINAGKAKEWGIEEGTKVEVYR
jgi:hypothetical protein